MDCAVVVVVFSVSFVNLHAEVLRRIWSRQDPAGALGQLESGCSGSGISAEEAFCASLFDVSGMAYTAEQVSAWLSELGLKIVANRGIRAFADYVPREHLRDPVFFDTLLRLEKAAADRAPYKHMARYVHLLARAPGGTAY